MMLLVFHLAGNLRLFVIVLKTSLRETDGDQAVRLRGSFLSPSGSLVFQGADF